MALVRVLSLGWGVQSFTLAAMSALGEIDRLDAAIHADTTHERQGTYALAAQFGPWLEAHDIQYACVQAKNIDLEQIPAYTVEGMPVTRQCTKDWKVRPVRAWLQKHRAGQQVEMWLGISVDEWHRAKDAPVKYITNRFPLLELEMTRQDCLNWLAAHGLPEPVKSSCTFCPFHSHRAWQELKRLGGCDWDNAVIADDDVTRRFDRYVHRSGVPLLQAVTIPEDHGYVQTGFDPEGRCDEGVCWV